MRVLLALDQGTTSSRAIVFNDAGQELARASKEISQKYPHNGWVEQDAEEIWETQAAMTLEALSNAGASAKDVIALGITNQRETTVVWDRKTGKPVAPAIVWQDRRTAQTCEQMQSEGKEDEIRQRTGLILDPYFSATKLRWILNHIDDGTARAKRGELAFGTIDSWLVWNLTNGTRHVTDVTNASRTLLFNIHEGQWDEKLLELFDIPREILPEICGNAEIIAEVRNPESLKGISIAGMAGDQQAALFGQACFERGMAKNTYGTGCFLLMNIGKKATLSTHRLLTTIAWQLNGETEYALEGSIFMGGAIVQWFRDNLGIIRDSAEIEALAMQVESADGVYLVPAFSGLGAPYWDPYARGAILGMTRGTTQAHLARAALDSIALQSADVLEAMTKDSNMELRELRVDGGASANDLLMQLQANLLEVNVSRSGYRESTAMGVACLAGLGAGHWKNKEEIANLWKEEKHFTPQTPSEANQIFRNGWKKAVKRAGHWEEKSSE